MRHTFLGLASLALLAACAGREPVVTTVTQVVDRPVKVACLKPEQTPSQPTRLSEDLPVPPATLTEMVGRLLAKLLEWADYGQTTEELLKICSTLPTPEAPPRP